MPGLLRRRPNQSLTDAMSLSARETILGRVREALTLKAPVPGHPHQAPAAIRLLRADRDARQWLPATGSSFEEHLQQFTTHAAALRAELEVFPNEGAMHARLKELAKDLHWQSIATHEGALTTPALAALGLPATVLTSAPYEATALERCEVGISECDALIAQTGSVLLTSRSGGGRALSVLPPHHLVLARRDQLLPDLPAAYELLHQKYGEAWPSLTTFITGPSRTGDIERILVLGAHGPKRLTIFLY